MSLSFDDVATEESAERSWKLHLEAFGGGLKFHGAMKEVLCECSTPASPGFGAAVLFDPYVLAANEKGGDADIYFGLANENDGAPAGIVDAGIFNSQKEKIVFESTRTPSGERTILNCGRYHRISPVGDEWSVTAECGELPFSLAKPGVAVFAANPFFVLCKYVFGMMDSDTNADILDMVVRTLLRSLGEKSALDSNDLRRDFHALGVSSHLLARLVSLHKRSDWTPGELKTGLRSATEFYLNDDFNAARKELKRLFLALEAVRKKILDVPIRIMHIPHGGILFEEKGFAEFDWPEAAAASLNFYLDWVDRFGYAFAPDIGAGTLENLAKTHPKTIDALSKAWKAGKIEFVNGTYSQPYLHLWPVEEQMEQFKVGLEVFRRLFGRTPKVYAAQEIALHPALPDILAEFGFEHAVHRVQNLGDAPIDEASLIRWKGAGGNSIRALPTHPALSEKTGNFLWERLPDIFSFEAESNKHPFVALASFIDQSFVGTFQEEILRSGQYCELWGRCVTPSEFFIETASIDTVERYYSLDEYDYFDELQPATNYHKYESGGFASTLQTIYSMAREIRGDGEKIDERTAKKLLEAQAHDSYILPYFKTGAFLELKMHEYPGPRYIVDTDAPRGTREFIKDIFDFSGPVSDFPDASGMSRLDSHSVQLGGMELVLNPENGEIVAINNFQTNIGLIVKNGAPLKDVVFLGNEKTLILQGAFDSGEMVRIAYETRDGSLLCQVEAEPNSFAWSSSVSAWDDCVRVRHSFPFPFKVERELAGVREKTLLERFSSTGDIVVVPENEMSSMPSFRFGHDGNIFHRQGDGFIENRLWSYNETAVAFSWRLSIKRRN